VSSNSAPSPARSAIRSSRQFRKSLQNGKRCTPSNPETVVLWLFPSPIRIRSLLIAPLMTSISRYSLRPFSVSTTRASLPTARWKSATAHKTASAKGKGTLQGNSGYGKPGAMPRGPRLDAAGVLPHVRARGIERQRIFQADAEREDVVQRLARVAAAEALTVYA